MTWAMEQTDSEIHLFFQRAIMTDSQVIISLKLESLAGLCLITCRGFDEVYPADR